MQGNYKINSVRFQSHQIKGDKTLIITDERQYKAETNLIIAHSKLSGKILYLQQYGLKKLQRSNVVLFIIEGEAKIKTHALSFQSVITEAT